MNGVGELHSTTMEVTMDSFFSGVQLHFTIDPHFLEGILCRFVEGDFLPVGFKERFAVASLSVLDLGLAGFGANHLRACSCGHSRHRHQ